MIRFRSLSLPLYPILFLITLAIILPRCAAETSQDEAAIRAVLGRYSSTLNAGDPQGWLALWDKDGVQLAADEPMHVGIANIKDSNAGFIEGLKNVTFNISMTTQEVMVFTAEGYGFARGIYHWDLTPKETNARTQTYNGKFLTIFKKQADGSWKIFRDCYNSNSPVTPSQ